MDMVAVGLSLQTMLLGMCGIFVVMALISLSITVLNCLFRR